MILENEGYGYNDLCIVPCEITKITSRSECLLERSFMFAAPMCNVVSENNYELLCNNGIQAIIPRTVKYQKRLDYLKQEKWVALSKNEFKKLFVDSVPEYTENNDKYAEFNVCIDTANGHLKGIYDDCKEAKRLSDKYGYVVNIMVGNIANPETYRYIIENYEGCVDYVRCAIGSGYACITSSNTNIHYPIASLIDECKKIKNEFEDPGDVYAGEYSHKCPAIIADGGIRGYKDIVTALALGADYVMMGSIIAALQESAAETVSIDNKMFKRYFGMATKEAQKLINEGLENPLPESELKLKTSEGTVKYIELGTSVDRWVRNLNDYVKSAMSYTNCKTIKEFTDKVNLKIMSPTERGAINK